MSTGAFIIWCSLNEQEIVSTQDKYFAAFQQFRDKLLEAGYGIKCNGARLNAAPLSKFENGPRVYILESGAKGLPENTVDIWDEADIDEFPDSRQQNRFIKSQRTMVDPLVPIMLLLKEPIMRQKKHFRWNSMETKLWSLFLSN